MEVDILIDEGSRITLASSTVMTMGCVVVPEGKRAVYDEVASFIGEHGERSKWKYADRHRADHVFGLLESHNIRVGFLRSPSGSEQAERFRRDFEGFRCWLSGRNSTAPVPGVTNYLRMRMTAWTIHLGLKYIGIEYQEARAPLTLLPGHAVTCRVNVLIDNYSYTDAERELLESGARDYASSRRTVDRSGRYPDLQPEISTVAFRSESQTPGMLLPDYLCGMMTMEAEPSYTHSLLGAGVGRSHYAQLLRERLPGPLYTASEYPALQLPPEVQEGG